MINLEITNSPDHNAISTFKYFQNQIYLGKSMGDLWIKDPDLKSSHLMLEVIGTDLLIHPQKNVEFYLINGKRASSIRKLKINDEVTIGNTNLKIIDYDETNIISKKNLLNEKLDLLINEDSPRIAVIESLTKLMK
jgi:hypothetical protein